MEGQPWARHFDFLCEAAPLRFLASGGRRRVGSAAGRFVAHYDPPLHGATAALFKRNRREGKTARLLSPFSWCTIAPCFSYAAAARRHTHSFLRGGGDRPQSRLGALFHTMRGRASADTGITSRLIYGDRIRIGSAAVLCRLTVFLLAHSTRALPLLPTCCYVTEILSSDAQFGQCTLNVLRSAERACGYSLRALEVECRARARRSD
ncbi:hypothetical protein NDU88_004894 [Pleurodeles waltl]|uniref:Uncharacterized protein n=1 Tax=Pleurodeles waltl TaxID=8319 RepID=A0AAV7RKL7_PLEWA|nr:hypothetical protein NDU88_004894 [Pleurodeles waltl]